MKYHYTGPVCRTHLYVNGKRQLVKLHPGEVELPEGHRYTLGLIARKLLTKVAAPSAAVTEVTTAPEVTAAPADESAPATTVATPTTSPATFPRAELATKPGHSAARRKAEGASK